MNIARTCVFEKPGPQEASLWVCWSAPSLGGTCATSTPLAGAPLAASRSLTPRTRSCLRSCTLPDRSHIWLRAHRVCRQATDRDL